MLRRKIPQQLEDIDERLLTLELQLDKLKMWTGATLTGSLYMPTKFRLDALGIHIEPSSVHEWITDVDAGGAERIAFQLSYLDVGGGGYNSFEFFATGSDSAAESQLYVGAMDADLTDGWRMKFDTNNDYFRIRRVASAGVVSEYPLNMTATETVFNESGLDRDFRIEGDTEENLFFVDAGNDRIGIGTTEPRAKLDILKDVSATPGTHLALLIDSALTNGFGFRTDGNTNLALDRFYGAAWNNVVTVERSSGNVGIGITDPDTLLELYKVGTQLKLSGGAADYATFAVAADGALTITTVDADSIDGHIMLIPDGSVGIGTTTPVWKLDISVPGITDDPTTQLAFHGVKDSNMGDGFGVGMLFSIEDDAAVRNYIGHISAERDGADDSGKFIFRPYSAGSPVDAITILHDGKVGIGITAPTKVLHVYGAVAPRIAIDGPANQYPGMEFFEAGARKWVIYNDTSDSFSFQDASALQMKIETGGGIHMPNMKTGTTQAGAGAAAGELWADTDDANTVKLGT